MIDAEKKAMPGKFEIVSRFLWAAALVTLPVTSFRFMPFMGSDSQVRPLSLIPAGLLLVLLFMKSILQRRLVFWNKYLLPLLIFTLIALIASVVGYFLAPVNLYQYSYGNRLIRAWITLAVGLVFLLVPIAMCRDEQDLKFTLKWLFIGFGIQFVWSVIQLLEFYVLEPYFEGTLGNLIDIIQKTIMVSGVSVNNRISGFALEPSWLAAQLATVYMPWLVASLIVGYRWVRWRWFSLIALMICLGMLVLTYSRSGILIAGGAIVVTLLITGRRRIRQAWEWLMKPFYKSVSPEYHRRKEILIRAFLLLVVVVGIAGGLFVLSRSYYFSRLWHVRDTNLVDYFVGIYAGPRLAYAWAGWEIFSQHPLSGVGLGGAGFYLQKLLPDWSHFNMTEMARLLASSNTTYPNTKNLYIRLLAETGIMGFWAFLSFYLAMLGKTFGLLDSPKRVMLFLGAASLMAVLGIMAFGVSQDSFAMANIWLPIGILLGMSASRK